MLVSRQKRFWRFSTYNEAHSFGRWWLFRGRDGDAVSILSDQLQLSNKASPEIVHL